MLLKLRRPAMRDESGFSLIEMLVSLIIFGIVSAVFTVSFVSIQGNYRKANAEVDSQTLARKAFVVLDTQVRYASNINDPATANGSQYIEWQSPCNTAYAACSGANVGTDQLCTQWRVTSVGLMQWRQWLLRATAPNTAVPATPTWNTAVTGLVTTGAPVFATPTADPAGSFAAIGEPYSVAAPTERQLLVSVTVASGTPTSQAAQTSVFSAANSTITIMNGLPVAPPVVCQQLGRP